MFQRALTVGSGGGVTFTELAYGSKEYNGTVTYSGLTIQMDEPVFITNIQVLRPSVTTPPQVRAYYKDGTPASDLVSMASKDTVYNIPLYSPYKLLEEITVKVVSGSEFSMTTQRAVSFYKVQ